MAENRDLVIRLYISDGQWVADTNLPGTPPIGRGDDWRVAIGELISKLHGERDVWEKFASIPRLDS